MEKTRARVIELINENERELIDLCCKLVQTKSENPPGDVSEAASVVQNFLKKRGISFKKIEPRAGHVNLIAEYRGRGRTLIINGHIDVVPAGDPSRWDFPPYCGEVRDGEILGRGSSDMKGGVAASLMALAAVKESGAKIRGRVVLAIVPDEETGVGYGTNWLLEHKVLLGDACLIAEPSGYTIFYYPVVAGERGVVWLKLLAVGKPAHGSTPALGENAVLRLNRVLLELLKLERRKVKIPKDASKLVAGGKRVLAMVAKKRGLPVYSLTRSIDHYTINVGKIAGGTKVNVVPEKCEAEVDIRIPPGGSVEEVISFAREVAPKDVGYEVVHSTAPSYTSADDRLVKVVRSNVRKVLGYTPPAMLMPAVSDAYSFRKILGIPTVSFGPGYIERAHAYNESVPVVDVVNAAKVFAAVIVDYLG